MHRQFSLTSTLCLAVNCSISGVIPLIVLIDRSFNFDVGSRVRNVATETAGVQNDPSLVIAVVSTVDAVIPPSLPTESNFKDQDGAEGWIL
jgi:hypothetical protein